MQGGRSNPHRKIVGLIQLWPPLNSHTVVIGSCRLSVPCPRIAAQIWCLKFWLCNTLVTCVGPHGSPPAPIIFKTKVNFLFYFKPIVSRSLTTFQFVSRNPLEVLFKNRSRTLQGRQDKCNPYWILFVLRLAAAACRVVRAAAYVNLPCYWSPIQTAWLPPFA